MRGAPSGSRHIRSDAGTRLGRPRHGKISCSRNIVIVSPASISPPRTAESECIHSRVDRFEMTVGSPVYVVSLTKCSGRSGGVWKS